MNLNRKTFIKSLLSMVCFTSIFSVAYATKLLPNEKTQNLFEEKQQTRAFARVVGEKTPTTGNSHIFGNIVSTGSFKDALGGFKNNSENPKSLSDGQKDILYKFLSEKAKILGLRSKTKDKDSAIRAFESVMGEEITPDNFTDIMGRYSKRIANIENSGKIEKYKNFFRKIAAELQDKDIDVVTLDKIAKESDLRVPPNGEVDLRNNNRSDEISGIKSEGLNRLAEIYSGELPKNDRRESIVALSKNIGDDLFFSLLTSNETAFR